MYAITVFSSTEQGVRRGWPETLRPPHNAERTENSPFLDLIFEDNRLNVYAGELEVRPPGAPTTNSDPTEKAAR
jgi:hypothetical protein